MDGLVATVTETRLWRDEWRCFQKWGVDVVEGEGGEDAGGATGDGGAREGEPGAPGPPGVGGGLGRGVGGKEAREDL
jgi:hypothetical protein